MGQEVKGRACTCTLELRPSTFHTVQARPGLPWLEIVATAQTLESAC